MPSESVAFAGVAHPREYGATSLLLSLVFAISAGCQSFAPGALAGLSASRSEKQALKQAETDPFPSPVDVGLEPPKATP